MCAACAHATPVVRPISALPDFAKPHYSDLSGLEEADFQCALKLLRMQYEAKCGGTWTVRTYPNKTEVITPAGQKICFAT
jgi:hypothetical protein